MSKIRVAVIGIGLVGSEFIKQLLSVPGSPFQLVALTSSTRTLFSPDTPITSSWKTQLSNSTEKADVKSLTERLKAPSDTHRQGRRRRQHLIGRHRGTLPALALLRAPCHHPQQEGLFRLVLLVRGHFEREQVHRRAIPERVDGWRRLTYHLDTQRSCPDRRQGPQN